MEKLLNEISVPERIGFSLPKLDIEKKSLSELIPDKYLSEEKPSLPEVSEPEIARHFINMSVTNHHIDKGFYPLGSCTMKYNPKINEVSARLSGFAGIHPEPTPHGRFMHQRRGPTLTMLPVPGRGNAGPSCVSIYPRLVRKTTRGRFRCRCPSPI